MSLLPSIRSVVLVFVVLFAILALSFNASLLAFSSFDGDGDDDDHSDLRRKIANFAGSGVGIAAFSLLVVLPVTVMNFVRQRSGAAIVLLEIGWVSILMILWVTAAGQAASAGIFSGGCSNADDDVQSLCMQYQALEGFEWLQFIILLVWLAVVMAVAAMAHFQGHTRVWLYPFCDAVVLCRPPPQRINASSPELKTAIQQQNGQRVPPNMPLPPQMPTLNVSTNLPQTTYQSQPNPNNLTVYHTPISTLPSPSQPPRYPSPVHRIPPPSLLPGDLSHPNSHRSSSERNYFDHSSGQDRVVNTDLPSDLPPVPQPDYRPLPFQPVPPGQANYRPLPPQPSYKPLTQEEISKLPQV